MNSVTRSERLPRPEVLTSVCCPRGQVSLQQRQGEDLQLRLQLQLHTAARSVAARRPGSRLGPGSLPVVTPPTVYDLAHLLAFGSTAKDLLIFKTHFGISHLQASLLYQIVIFLQSGSILPISVTSTPLSVPHTQQKGLHLLHFLIPKRRVQYNKRGGRHDCPPSVQPSFSGLPELLQDHPRRPILACSSRTLAHHCQSWEVG